MLLFHGRERANRSAQSRYAIVCLLMEVVFLGVASGPLAAQPQRLPATATRLSTPLAVPARTGAG